MNERFNKLRQYNTSGLGCWVSLIIFALIVGKIGLGGVVSGFLILIALFFLVPVIGFWGFQWWLKQKITQAQCPVCEYEFTGLKNTEFNCPSCGESLRVEGDRFTRMTPPGTIDVDAVEVSVQRIEEEN
ncbi:hypothetical protein I4641_09745 [Waterburya agarophytonicola K14]|uniref:Uncharacterized protein n=1 Tax=Waterburya agarophytonicola KI4 TaxID=2874699 RepID=A0A964BPL3_9CYAN|nr:hypothetical protein [Waterburya agarophytonicola]MCC0177258.1 hypothetical protein [Waterburya agarophytonicola KI4]